MLVCLELFDSSTEENGFIHYGSIPPPLGAGIFIQSTLLETCKQW